jgi:hypothetical protein
MVDERLTIRSTRVVLENNKEHRCATVVALYAARLGDLGPSDFVKVDCSACSHTALLTRESLDRHGLGPHRKVLDLKDQVRCRGCGVRGRAVVSIRRGKPVA